MIEQLYGLFLRLYPAAFYAEFADEMQEIFEIALWDARRHNRVLFFCGHELTGLLFSVLREHLHREAVPGSVRKTQQARWIIRAGSLAFSSFLLIMTMASQPGNEMEATSNLLSGVLMILLSAGLMIAWRWERSGGIIVIVSAVTIGCILYQMFLIIGFATWQAVLGAALMVLPYALFGLFFIFLSIQSNKYKNQGATHDDNGYRGIRATQELRAW